MKFQRISSILKNSPQEGQPYTVAGWIRTKRQSKNYTFISLNDGSTQDSLQIIFAEDASAELQSHQDLSHSLKRAQTGSSVRIEGLLKKSPGKNQAWEIEGHHIEILGEADPETYPLQKKGHSLEFLRDNAHLRGRTNTFGAVFRVRNALAYSVHQFFQERGFVWAQTPIISASDCEGAGELFTVTTLPLQNVPQTSKGEVDYSKDFFGKKSFLTVSGQLEGEFLALSLGNIYTFGPTFRAENSNTHRHLAEFWMVEPEVAFADLKDNRELAEDFMKFQLQAVLKLCPDELQFLSQTYKNMTPEGLEAVSSSSFGHITYTDAIQTLKASKKAFEFPVEWGNDLKTEHERFLAEEVFKKPVVVTDYPKDIKAFYMRMNDDSRTVAAMDILVPGVGEIMGGSQREERLDFLTRRMESMAIPQHDLQWYLDLRRFGGVPHAGFGLGFERLVMYVTGMQNIRDVIMCPRAPGLVSF